MAKFNANTLSNSLKGKIWLATIAMAFFVCTSGLISYLVVSFLVEDTFYAIFIPFLCLAFGIMVFGWWLSNEVVSPIEKVAMLAQSLERSASISLPKTTGSTETDELLQTLHRSSRQTQNLVTLMEEVSSGNTNVALTPLQNSDRLSASFQKLLAKVSDSIDAKQQLESLRTAVSQITAEISRIRRGSLDSTVSSDFKETKEITETLRFLLNNLSEVVGTIRVETASSRTCVLDVRRSVQEIVQQKEAKVQDLKRAAGTLQEMPNGLKKIAESLANAAAAGNRSIETARAGAQTAQENRVALGSLRRQIQEAMGRLGRLAERSREISKAAKTVEDLAHRTNMIALNASIHAGETGSKSSGFTVITEEIERLAQRAENTNRQISALNKSMSVEIGEVERALGTTAKEIAELTRFALETGGSLGELEKYLTQFLSLQAQIAGDSNEQVAQSERALGIFTGSIVQTEENIVSLRHTEHEIARFSGMLERLELSAAHFKLAEAESAAAAPAGPGPYAGFESPMFEASAAADEFESQSLAEMELEGAVR